MGWCEEQGPHEDVDCIVPTWLASRGLCFRTPLRGERWLKDLEDCCSLTNSQAV